MSYSPCQLGYEAVILKGNKAFSNDNSSIKNLVLVSDFQQKEQGNDLPIKETVRTKFVKLNPTNKNNISIDSVYVSRVTSENIELAVQIRNQGNPISTLPISLFETNNLVAKNAVEIDTETSAIFTIPANKKFNGSCSTSTGVIHF